MSFSFFAFHLHSRQCRFIWDMCYTSTCLLFIMTFHCPLYWRLFNYNLRIQRQLQKLLNPVSSQQYLFLPCLHLLLLQSWSPQQQQQQQAADDPDQRGPDPSPARWRLWRGAWAPLSRGSPRLFCGSIGRWIGLMAALKREEMWKGGRLWRWRFRRWRAGGRLRRGRGRMWRGVLGRTFFFLIHVSILMLFIWCLFDVWVRRCAGIEE